MPFDPTTSKEIIPGAQIRLGRVILNAASTSAQTLFTCPIGTYAVVTGLAFRRASAALNAATTFGVASGNLTTAGTPPAGQNDIVASGNTAIESLPAAAAATGSAASVDPVVYVRPNGISNSTANASELATVEPGSVCTITFAGTQTGNGNVECDILGYLVHA